jgi:hypothetical protein
LTACLQKAVETPAELECSGPAGAELRPGVWQPPEAISADDLASAQRWLRLYEADVAEVEISAASQWLASLINGVVAGMSERDVELKVQTLAFAVADRKASFFDGQTLRAAWARFQFVPSAKELMAFFDEMEAEERTEAQRLMKIVDLGVRDKPKQRDPQAKDFKWSRAEAEDHGRWLYEQKAKERREILAGLGIETQPVPPQASGEPDVAYVHRLVEWTSETGRQGVKDLERLIRQEKREAKP